MGLWIGTSGWQYKHWRGVFYPEGLPQRAWLPRYAEEFRCVEVNNAFYRLPERSTFESWRDQLPDGFLVAVKVSRYLTHIRRLAEPEDPVHRLVDRAVGLDDRIGPYLLQLPPNLRGAPDRLDTCLAAFPRAARVAVEPRHESWWTDGVRGVLEKHGAALCWADRMSHLETPLWVTADWGYVRLHEGRAKPHPAYGRGALRSWLERLTKTWPDLGPDKGPDVFVFFNNDGGGAAIHNARTLDRMARR